MLVHQLLLTEKRGLPLSRLLCLKRTEARSQTEGRREQEESASPILRRRRSKAAGGERGAGEMREEVEEMKNEVCGLRGEVEKRREEVRCCSTSALTDDTNLPTPRSSKTEITTSSSQAFPQIPGTPPFPNLTNLPTAYTIPFSPAYALPFTAPHTLPFTPPNTSLFTLGVGRCIVFALESSFCDI